MRGRAPGVLAVALAGALLLSGCGGGDGADQAAGGSTDHSAMDVTSMNDPDATPAYDVGGAAEGEFEVLDSAPPDSEGVTGQAWLAQQDGTTVSVELTGLEPGATYLGHLHAQPCGTDDGGEHFRFDPAGEDVPPNEVHLGLEADADGTARATTTNDREVGDGAPSVVVHPADLPDNRLACADF